MELRRDGYDFSYVESRNFFWETAPLVWTLHFVSYAVGQLFNFFGFLDYIEGEEIFIGFVYRCLQFDREPEQLLRIVL